MAAALDPPLSLRPLLRPHSIALVGVSESSAWSRRIVENLRLQGFPGEVFMVNPRRPTVFGVPAYPSLQAVPGEIDLAFVMVPTEAAVAVARDCAARRVGGVVMLTSGFAEVGPEGLARQQEVARILAAAGVALCGPNCLGYINAPDRVAAYTLAMGEAVQPGRIGMVLQSGALLSPVLRATQRRGLGLGLLVSSGNEAMLDATDYLAYMVEDPNLQVLGALLEGIRRPPAFAAVCRRAGALGKPLVVLKVGRSEVGQRAALAHTGALAGSARFVDAFLRRQGVIQVGNLEDLIETLGLLAAHGRPPGDRIALVAASGGICGVASDLGSELGLRFPAFAATTVTGLQRVLPPFATAQNPLDVTGYGAVQPELFNNALDVVVRDPGVDAVVAVTALPEAPGPDAATQERRLARTAEIVHGSGRYVVLTGYTLAEPSAYARDLCRRHGLFFAAGVAMALRAIRAAAPQTPPPSTATAERRAASGPVLDEVAAKRLLAGYGIRAPREALATSAAAAVAAAREIGFPVVLKVVSSDIPHKSEAGAVALGVADAAEAAAAYERILAAARAHRPEARVEGVLVAEQVRGGVEMLAGVQVDPEFGPGVLVSFGGIYAEILQDTALRLVPLDRGEAEAMVRGLRGWPILAGARGRPAADVDALAEVLVGLSELARCLGDRLRSIDINPLVVLPAGRGVVALDALVELAPERTAPPG
jgi:acyl-CoA synthetase (NDP forming)